MEMRIDAAHNEKKPLRTLDYQEKQEFAKLAAGEPRCECGHGLYYHYMCGGGGETYCMTRCGCGQFKPSLSVTR